MLFLGDELIILLEWSCLLFQVKRHGRDCPDEGRGRVIETRATIEIFFYISAWWDN